MRRFVTWNTIAAPLIVLALVASASLQAASALSANSISPHGKASALTAGSKTVSEIFSGSDRIKANAAEFRVEAVFSL